MTILGEMLVNDGIQKGIEAFILDNLEEGIKKDRIIEKLQKRFQLSPEEAEKYWFKYADC